MKDLNTHFTILIGNDNLKKIEDTDDLVVLASKEIWYDADYSVAEILMTGSHEDLEPEKVLNDLGALVYHEDGTYGFLVLEEDLPEITRIYTWEGAMGVLMGDMLTVGDKALLLAKKRNFLKLPEADIYICVDAKNEEFKLIKDAANEVFQDVTSTYRFGIAGHSTEVWWPHLLGDVGGYYYVVKNKEPKEEQQQLPLLPAPKHSVTPPGNYLYNDDYDDYYDMYDPHYAMWMRGMI